MRELHNEGSRSVAVVTDHNIEQFVILDVCLIALCIVDESRQQVRFLGLVHLTLSSGAVNDVVSKVRNDAHVVRDDPLGAEAERALERPQRAEESRARVRLNQVERLGEGNLGAVAQTARCLTKGNLGEGIECVAEVEILRAQGQREALAAENGMSRLFKRRLQTLQVPPPSSSCS
jgi:hypothetical protein